MLLLLNWLLFYQVIFSMKLEDEVIGKAAYSMVLDKNSIVSDKVQYMWHNLTAYKVGLIVHCVALIRDILKTGDALGAIADYGNITQKWLQLFHLEMTPENYRCFIDSHLLFEEIVIALDKVG